MSGPVSPNYTGWYVPTGGGSGRLYVAGTLVATWDDATNDLVLPTNGLTITAGGLTVTAGGATITAGDVTLSAAGAAFVAATGNVELGNPGAFGTTQPQGAVVMGGTSLSGIAPAGAIATAGGIFASDTVVRKIIAAGTVSNVET